MDLLSDISEEDPFGEADRITLDSLDRLCTGEALEQGPCEPGLGPLEAPSEPARPPVPALKEADHTDPECGSFFRFCRCSLPRFPSLLDEDGSLAFRSLPKVWVSLLPADARRSASFFPSLILLFGLLLSASQSVPFSLALSLPLALSLCYLEARAAALTAPYDCDWSDKAEEEEALTGCPPSASDLCGQGCSTSP